MPFLQPKLKKLLYCQKVWWGIMQMSYFFLSLREDTLTEVHKIKKQNLKPEQCTI